MKIRLQNHNTIPALLRNACVVGAQKTKSLCCAAAGITAPVSATTEALIPHEKLREAAHPDATLNAQSRPPAQPVLAGRPPIESFHFQYRQNSRSYTDLLRVVREDSCTSQAIDVATSSREQARKDDALLKCTSNYQKWLNHFRQRKLYRIDATHRHQLFLNSRENLENFRLSCRLNCREALEQKATYTSSALSDSTNEQKNNLITLASRVSGITSLFVSNVERCKNSSYSTKSLNPSCCLVLYAESIEHYKQRPTQRPNSYAHPNSPNTGNFQNFWRFKNNHKTRPPAIKPIRILNVLEISAHGGANNTTPITTVPNSQPPLNPVRKSRVHLGLPFRNPSIKVQDPIAENIVPTQKMTALNRASLSEEEATA